MKFPKGNKIIYGQDFSWKVGVPSNVEFTVREVYEDRMFLTAPGYGEKPYGNGGIFIYFERKKDDAQVNQDILIEKVREAIKLVQRLNNILIEFEKK